MTTASLLDFIDGAETLADISPALDRAIASPHSTILMPAGMLAIATRQPAAAAVGKTFEGGRLRFAAGSGARLLLGSGSALLGVQIDGDGRQNGNNLVSTVPGCTGITIEDAELGNCSGNAVVINTGVSQVRIRRTAFADTGNPSVPGFVAATSGAGVYAGSVSDIRIEQDCTFVRSYGQGAVMLSACTDWTLQDAQFRDTFYRGVSAWGHNVGEMHDLRGWDIGSINNRTDAESGVGTNFVFVGLTRRAEDVLVRDCKVWRVGENFFEGVAIFEGCYGRWSAAFGLNTPSDEGYFLGGRGAVARGCTAVDTVGPSYRYYISTADEGPLMDGVTGIRSGGPVVRVHADGVAVSNARIRGVIGRGGDTALKGIEIIGTVAGEIRGCDMDRTAQQIPATMRQVDNSWQSASTNEEVPVAEVGSLALPVRGTDNILMTRGAEGPLLVPVSSLSLTAQAVTQSPEAIELSRIYGVSPETPTVTVVAGQPAGTRRVAPWSSQAFASGAAPVWRNAQAQYRLPHEGAGFTDVEVDAESRTFGLGYMRASGQAEGWRIWVDGLPVQTDVMSPTAATTAGALSWLQVTFAERRRRCVRIQIAGAYGLNSVLVDTGALVYPQAVQRRKVAFVADSCATLSALAGAQVQSWLDTMPARYAALTGHDVHVDADRDAGYLQPGAKGTTFGLASRVARVGAFGAHDIILASGISDDPNAPGYVAAVASVMAQYKPLAASRLIIVGPMATTAGAATGTWKRLQSSTLAAAAASSGALFLDSTGLAETDEVPPNWSSVVSNNAGEYVTHLGAIWRAAQGDSMLGIYREPGAYAAAWHLRGVLPLVGTGHVAAPAGNGERDVCLESDGYTRTRQGALYDAMRLAEAVNRFPCP